MDDARIKAIEEVKSAAIAKAKDKAWRALSPSDKDELLKAVCKMLGLYGRAD